MCLLRRLGLSNALPQTSHGNSVRSARGARLLDVRFIWPPWPVLRTVVTRSVGVRSDTAESPDKDLCSVSVVSPGDDDPELLIKARDNSDIDRSSGESETKKEVHRLTRDEIEEGSL